MINKLVAVLVLIFPFVLKGQHISGVIIDSENRGIPSVNIVVESIGKGTVSDEDGSFVLKDIPLGKYNLKVSAIGYKTKTVDCNIFKGDILQLRISLSEKNEQIDVVDIIEKNADNLLINEPSSESISLKSSVSTVTYLDVQKQGAITVIDALKFVPGGWIETRGRKVKQFFSVRGQKYPYPTYLINGIWQKEFHETPYFMSSANVEEINIVRSSAALIKSLSPLVGVIDVKTRKPKKEEVDVFLKYGSQNMYQGEVGYGNVKNKVSYSAKVGSFGTNGPKNRNGNEQIWNASGNVNWEINDKINWDVNLLYITGVRELVQPIAPADAKFTLRKEKYDPLNTLLLTSKLKYKINNKFSSELDLSYADRQANYENRNLSKGTVTKYDENDFEFTASNLNAFKIGDLNTLRFGVLYSYWEAPEGKRFYYGKTARVSTVSGYIADEHRLGKVVLDAGFRYTGTYFDQWGGFNIEGSGGKFSKVKAIENEWQSPVWNATAGISYLLPNNNSIHYSMGSGIVTPRNGALTSNATHPKKETRFNFDLGYIKSFKNQGRLSATAFVVDRSNAIGFSGSTIDMENGDVMELYHNTDKRNYGIELELKSPIMQRGFGAFANITFLKGEERDIDGWQEDEEMPNIIANIGGSYQKKEWDINAFIHHVGAYENNRFVSKAYLNEYGKAPLGDFVSVDLNIGYKISNKHNLRMFCEVKNIFDKEFQTVAGYPDNGRLISIGFSMKRP